MPIRTANAFDGITRLYTDIYCDVEVPAAQLEEVLAKTGSIFRASVARSARCSGAPPPMNKDEIYISNGNEDRCAVRAKSDALPWTFLKVKELELAVPQKYGASR